MAFSRMGKPSGANSGPEYRTGQIVGRMSYLLGDTGTDTVVG